MSVIFGVKTPTGALLAADTLVQHGGTRCPPACKIVIYSKRIAIACCGDAEAIDVLRDFETRLAVDVLVKECGDDRYIDSRALRKVLRRAFLDAGYRPKETSPILVNANFVLACGGEVMGLSGALQSASNPACGDQPVAFGAGAQAALGSWWTSGRPREQEQHPCYRAVTAIHAAAAANVHCSSIVDLWRSGDERTQRSYLVENVTATEPPATQK